ncbi:MAG: ion channel [Gemmatimonadota bacterium]
MSDDRTSTPDTDAASRPAGGRRFAALFWLLVVAIALPVAVPDGPIIRKTMAAVLFVVMLSGLNAIAYRRGELIIGICLALPAVVLNGLGLALGNLTLYQISHFGYLAFFAYLAILMLRWTLRQHEIEAETIYGAVSVYLLLALVWGLLYYSMALTHPGSFHFPVDDELGAIQAARVDQGSSSTLTVADGELRRVSDSAQGTLMYYSFVTLTTLGYGDIYPVSDAARILAMLEATLGQLYLVILVARLVGLYTSQEQERRRKATPT